MRTFKMPPTDAIERCAEQSGDDEAREQLLALRDLALVLRRILPDEPQNFSMIGSMCGIQNDCLYMKRPDGTELVARMKNGRPTLDAKTRAELEEHGE